MHSGVTCISFSESNRMDSMADLGFGKDPAETLQGGTGDPAYVEFIHKFMAVLSVSLSNQNSHGTHCFPFFDRLNSDLGFHVSSEPLSVLPLSTSLAALFPFPNLHIPRRAFDFHPSGPGRKSLPGKGRKNDEGTAKARQVS